MSSLPPRKRLRAARPPPTWHTTPFTDHAGAPAQALRFGPGGDDDDDDDAAAAAPAFQLYVAVPGLADPEPCVRLLAGADLLSARDGVRFDVYAAEAFGGVFACVEHQRREIRRRGDAIPRFAAGAYVKPMGLIVVLTAEVDVEEVERRKREELGREAEDGPLLVWFEREGRKAVRVPGDLEVEEGGELALERVEVKGVRVREWGKVEGELVRVGVEEGDAGVGDGGDEEEERAKDREEERTGGAAVKEHQLVTKHITDGSGNHAITVTNAPEVSTLDRCDLHYLVYDIEGGATNPSDDDLASVAMLFASTLLSHCAPDTTALLEIHRASSLQASIEHFRHEQQARPELTVGYLSPRSSESSLVCRIFPSSPEIEAGIDKHRAATLGAGMPQSGFKTFLVALESRNFVREDSVLLVRSDPDFSALRRLMGKTSEEGGDDAGMSGVGSAVEILVGRPPGMEAVAKRLCGTL